MHADRYAAVVDGPAPEDLHVVGCGSGTSKTDVAAPDARGPWDDASADGERLATVLQACWTVREIEDGDPVGAPPRRAT